MTTFTIKHAITDATLAETEAETLKDALVALVIKGADLRGAYLTWADLRGADLRGADLTGAYLRGAYLTGAYLTGAYLTGADLRGAYLTWADLRGADLTGAYLTGAYLRGADLRGADLTGADLRGADLTGAYLRGADLRGADLTGADLRGADLRGAIQTQANEDNIKTDLYRVISATLNEIPGIRDALIAGRINGSSYYGECACLLGTIGKLRHCDPRRIPGITANSTSLAELWFLSIKPGHTPETSPKVALTLKWIDEWVAANPQPEAAK